MNLDDMKTKYLNKQFLTYYAIVFVLLYVFFSFIRFLGQLPVLLIITFFVTYYVTDNSSSNDGNSNSNNTFYKISSLLSSATSNKIVPEHTSDKKIEKYSEPEIIIGSESEPKKTPPLGYNSFS
jgi:c-di-AMP phosphodiesterase-like protein